MIFQFNEAPFQPERIQAVCCGMKAATIQVKVQFFPLSPHHPGCHIQVDSPGCQLNIKINYLDWSHFLEIFFFRFRV